MGEFYEIQKIKESISEAETAAMTFQELRDLGLCGKLKADKVHRCRHIAGEHSSHFGYGACGYHGGNRESDRMSAAKDELKARSFTMKVDVSATEALVSALHMSAGAVAYCQLKIQALEAEKAQLEFDDNGYHKTAQSRNLSTWMSLYGVERDRMTVCAEKCLKAGIQERQVRAIEARAGILGDALALSLKQAEIPPSQVREILGHLRTNLAQMAQLTTETIDGQPAASALPTKTQQKALST